MINVQTDGAGWGIDAPSGQRICFRNELDAHRVAGVFDDLDLKTYAHWYDVPTRYCAAVEIRLRDEAVTQEGRSSGVLIIIAAGDDLTTAKRLAWDALGTVGGEVMVKSLENGTYSGPSRFDGEPWSDER